MADTKNWRILQIMPAEGYAAEVLNATTSHTSYERLCGWALVQEIGASRTFVTGLIPESGIEEECAFAADLAGFQRFIYDPNPLK
jgi:hypothetical protein